MRNIRNLFWRTRSGEKVALKQRWVPMKITSNFEMEMTIRLGKLIILSFM